MQTAAFVAVYGVALTAAANDGAGAIIRRRGQRYAVHRDESGGLHSVSAICTHLGCTVLFNDAEHTWDCPCHGSRFTADGNVIHGPATTPLERRTVEP